MSNSSDPIAVEFRDVLKRFRKTFRQPIGLKEALLHLPSVLRRARAAEYHAALDGVSFEVRRGETFGVWGRNGSGKSTTLALMAGVMEPTRGTVRVNGRVCPLLDLGAGLHPELSGRDNVVLNGLILGMRRREVLRRMDSIVEFSEIGGFIDEPLRTYSSGMVMRLAFSVAIHAEPEILLIDEVLAVGDATFRRKCLDRMREFHQEGVTIVFVSHDEALMRKICDRTLVLGGGKTVYLGPPDGIPAP